MKTLSGWTRGAAAPFLFGTALALLLPAGPAAAHTDEHLDSQRAPNGGQTRAAGAYHFELVVVRDSKAARDNPVVVYLTDHAGAKVPSKGASGTATLLGSGVKATAALAPDGDNRLKGMAAYASVPDLKVVVSVTMPGQSAEQARFTPLAPAKGDPKGDHKGGHGKH